MKPSHAPLSHQTPCLCYNLGCLLKATAEEPTIVPTAVVEPPAPERLAEAQSASVPLAKPKNKSLIGKLVSAWKNSPKRKSRREEKARKVSRAAAIKAGKKDAVAKPAPPSSPPKTDPSRDAANRRTVPKTPKVLRRSSRTASKSKILSTEERELMEIKMKREETNKRRRISRESFQRLSSSGLLGLSKVAAKPTTKPVSPKFQSRKPAAPRPPRAGAPEQVMNRLPFAPTQHGMVLRSTITTKNYAGKTTVAKPFKLTGQKRGREQTRASPFRSMAQRIQKYNETPDRYHTRKAADTYKSTEHQPGPAQPTKAKSPNLRTADRLVLSV